VQTQGLVFVVDGACGDLKAPRLERVDESRLGHRPGGGSEGAGGVAEVALGLSEVVGFGVGLAGQRLVGQLGVAAVGERVVGLRPIRGPLAKLAAGSARGAVQLPP
jgi:hypothetical protein